MGWASGSDIAVEIVKAVKENVPDKKARKRIYIAVKDALESHDWDTQDEAMGIDPLFDEVLEP